MEELPSVTNLLVTLKADADRLSGAKASLEREVFSLERKRDELLLDTATAMDLEFSNERRSLKDWSDRLNSESSSLMRRNSDLVTLWLHLSDRESDVYKREKDVIASKNDLDSRSGAIEARERSCIAREEENARIRNENESLAESLWERESKVTESESNLSSREEKLRSERERFESSSKVRIAAFEEREKRIISEQDKLASDWRALKSAKAHIDNLKAWNRSSR